MTYSRTTSIDSMLKDFYARSLSNITNNKFKDVVVDTTVGVVQLVENDEDMFSMKTRLTLEFRNSLTTNRLKLIDYVDKTKVVETIDSIMQELYDEFLEELMEQLEQVLLTATITSLTADDFRRYYESAGD